MFSSQRLVCLLFMCLCLICDNNTVAESWEEDLAFEDELNIAHRMEMGVDSQKGFDFADNPPVFAAPRCTVPVNVGFLLDSSASLVGFYQTEKNFLKSLASAFDLSDFGSRASVITFGENTDFSIKFKDGVNFGSFISKVDSIPFMRSRTRIDKALRLAQKEMFTTENGAIPDRANVLFLLTDGMQNKKKDSEDPAAVAAELRHQGVIVISIGIGDGVDDKELEAIAGYKSNVFRAQNFAQLMGWEFIQSLTTTSCGFIMLPSVQKCDKSVNVGFLLDSSASLLGHYQTEKNFVKSVADAFNIITGGSKASVVTFSSNAHLSIKFQDGDNLDTFRDNVDAIPFYRKKTRIDLALRLAQKEMFKAENGAIADRPKLLFLVTDGVQTKRKGTEDPAAVAAQLRKEGVITISVGVGGGIDVDELKAIAGDGRQVFSASNFEELMKWKFIQILTKKSCEYTH